MSQHKNQGKYNIVVITYNSLEKLENFEYGD
jgi:hypothetical protein